MNNRENEGPENEGKERKDKKAGIAARARATVALLRSRGRTLSCAESCTGGWFAKSIVDIAGASEVFSGGVVSYATEVKTGLLGVPAWIIERDTVVSTAVAEAMAEGVRRLIGSDLAVSVTGLAGPGGGTEAIPVGCVCVGVTGRTGTVSRRYMLTGTRTGIRRLAVACMYDLLREYITDEPQKGEE